MAQPTVNLDQHTYVCTAECIYRDQPFGVGDELKMSEREAGFLVSKGKFALKTESAAVEAVVTEASLSAASESTASLSTAMPVKSSGKEVTK
ncbi:hypothetical protein DTO96_102396 [Ephemeroptericola cinctiostellae]|uniref:Uncharacterized protein n=1 Tax=Ephemeroptericola cinctiostellae TaxID=2268024 RepID=A0A345DE53_9BURK|nr:hypothetical protein [Ephemeroptericola cinctiostellae]AXF86641.1 hypothetical protein DTO96_102396 [Ephemeroptericola cinctiostellae]